MEIHAVPNHFTFTFWRSKKERHHSVSVQTSLVSVTQAWGPSETEAGGAVMRRWGLNKDPLHSGCWCQIVTIKPNVIHKNIPLHEKKPPKAKQKHETKHTLNLTWGCCTTQQHALHKLTDTILTSALNLVFAKTTSKEGIYDTRKKNKQKTQ